MPRTVGISPKVIAAVVGAIVSYVAVHYGVNIDADLEHAVTVLVLGAAAAWAPPGLVVQPDTEA